MDRPVLTVPPLDPVQGMEDTRMVGLESDRVKKMIARTVVLFVIYAFALCLFGTWAASQDRSADGHLSGDAPAIWVWHQALKADPAGQKVSVRLFYKTNSASVADSFIVAWSRSGASPDSVKGDRDALPYVPSHLDSLLIQRKFAHSDTVIVAGWTRLRNRWSRQLMDTIIVARDTLRPPVEMTQPETDTIPPARVNDLG